MEKLNKNTVGALPEVMEANLIPSCVIMQQTCQIDLPCMQLRFRTKMQRGSKTKTLIL
jgi:hypothetical protein